MNDKDEFLTVKLLLHFLVGCDGQLVCSHHLLDTVGECQFILHADGFFGDMVNPCEESAGDYRHCDEYHHHIQKCRFQLFHFFVTSPNLIGLTYVLIRGVNAFMIRMANDIPSGYAPQLRITTVSTPIPTPYISCPRPHIGDVT